MNYKYDLQINDKIIKIIIIKQLHIIIKIVKSIIFIMKKYV